MSRFTNIVSSRGPQYSWTSNITDNLNSRAGLLSLMKFTIYFLGSNVNVTDRSNVCIIWYFSPKSSTVVVTLNFVRSFAIMVYKSCSAIRLPGRGDWNKEDGIKLRLEFKIMAFIISQHRRIHVLYWSCWYKATQTML